MKRTRLSPLLSEDSSGALCDTFQALILPKDCSVGLGGQALLMGISISALSATQSTPCELFGLVKHSMKDILFQF